jgi:hypothetical protein
LEAAVIIWGQRSWEIFRESGKIFGNNETRVEMVALSGQVV